MGAVDLEIPVRGGIRAAALGMTLCMAAWRCSASAGRAAEEAEIKAAMVFNFTKFMQWTGPRGNPKSELVIGVAGDDEVHDALAELTRDGVSGRPVKLLRISQAAQGEVCHVLFLGRRWKKRAPEFTPLARRGVVTVGDSDDFLEAGGAIAFIVVDNKLRFEVGLSAANQAGVTVSSRLLRLATVVRP